MKSISFKYIRLMMIAICLIIQAGYSQEHIGYKTKVSFEQNVGQKDSRVQFFTHGKGFALFLTSNSMVFDFTNKINNKSDLNRMVKSFDSMGKRFKKT